MLKPLAVSALFLAAHAHATPETAERIRRGYELSAETWALKYKLAATPSEKQELMASRPDPQKAAKDLWADIAPSLKEEWVIPHAAWFMDLTRNLTAPGADGSPQPAFPAERQRILAAFSENHIAKPGIGPFCIALAESGDPQALGILEKVITGNPDEPTQGIAALGASMLLKNLGDAPEVMAKRLTYLRTAIIQASDQKIGASSVADIATDELYVIRFLSKGRIAPELSGTDVAGREIRLSDFKGKTVILLFWDAKSPETDKIIGLTNNLAVKYEGKPVAVLGVTPESLDRIRALQADGSIRWNNIIDPSDKLAAEYRVASRPAVLVLDAAGKIEYSGLPGSFLELTVDALISAAGSGE
ncbi:redoxin domain-containing protein [Akkermansiaceae bacterium]|nr:redoxin domain-containing protein [Akkermansiaceae bacterium]